MKKIMALSIISIILLTNNTYSQDKFTSYDNDFTEKTYDIDISFSDKAGFTLWIDAMSMDKLHEKGGFMVKEKQYEPFIKSLNDAKLKYKEWVNTAKENDIKDLTKKMSIKSKIGCYFLYGSDWHFDYVANLSFKFLILESEGELSYILTVMTGELTSSKNEFMDVEGFGLVFSSVNEIESFTSKISLQKINDFKNKPKAEDLFK